MTSRCLEIPYRTYRQRPSLLWGSSRFSRSRSASSQHGSWTRIPSLVNVYKALPCSDAHCSWFSRASDPESGCVWERAMDRPEDIRVHIGNKEIVPSPTRLNSSCRLCHRRVLAFEVGFAVPTSGYDAIQQGCEGWMRRRLVYPLGLPAIYPKLDSQSVTSSSFERSPS
jgi:hypothetical protein